MVCWTVFDVWGEASLVTRGGGGLWFGLLKVEGWTILSCSLADVFLCIVDVDVFEYADLTASTPQNPRRVLDSSARRVTCGVTGEHCTQVPLCCDVSLAVERISCFPNREWLTEDPEVKKVPIRKHRVGTRVPSGKQRAPQHSRRKTTVP